MKLTKPSHNPSSPKSHLTTAASQSNLATAPATETHVTASQKAISQSQQYKIDITSIAVGMAISCTSAYSLLRLSKRRRREFVSSPCCFNILISASWVWLASSEALIFFFRSSNSSRWLSITSWSAAATCFSSWTSASSSCTCAVLARLFGPASWRPTFCRNLDDGRTWATT